jgi:hypothetical protein
MVAVRLREEQTKRTLRLRPCRWSEAEAIIASVWQLLEREDIAMPRVAVCVTEHASVHLSLIFRSRADAENLREALRRSRHAFMCEEATDQAR